MPAFRSRLVTHFLGLLLVLAALLVVQSGLRWAMARFSGPSRHGEWIWAAHLTSWHRGVSFYAVRDFDLEAVPEEVRLFVQADQEYTLRLNGVRVGSGRYRSGDRLDTYEVSGLLRPGSNRMVANLVSSEGLGGFLAVLDGEGMDPVGTDADWRIVGAWQRGLYDGTLPIDGRARARVWGGPPAGRWGAPRPGTDLPVFDDLVLGTTGPSRYRPWKARGKSKWNRAGRRVLGPIAPGPGVELRWRSAETGYLVLHFRHGVPPKALVWAGDERPRPERQRPTAYVIGARGRTSWAMAQPMTIKYAVVLGMDGLLDASIVRVRPDLAEPLMWEPDAAEGVMGLEPPRLGSALENEIWSKLEGFPSG